MADRAKKRGVGFVDAPEDTKLEAQAPYCFVPEKDIDLVCLVFYVQEFVDAGAGIRTGPHWEDKTVRGFWIQSRFSLSQANILDIKLDSRDWLKERQKNHVRYVDSKTAKNRRKKGATQPDRHPQATKPVPTPKEEESVKDRHAPPSDPISIASKQTTGKPGLQRAGSLPNQAGVVYDTALQSPTISRTTINKSAPPVELLRSPSPNDMNYDGMNPTRHQAEMSPPPTYLEASGFSASAPPRQGSQPAIAPIGQRHLPDQQGNIIPNISKPKPTHPGGSGPGPIGFSEPERAAGRPGMGRDYDDKYDDKYDDRYGDKYDDEMPGVEYESRRTDSANRRRDDPGRREDNARRRDDDSRRYYGDDRRAGDPHRRDPRDRDPRDLREDEERRQGEVRRQGSDSRHQSNYGARR